MKYLLVNNIRDFLIIFDLFLLVDLDVGFGQNLSFFREWRDHSVFINDVSVVLILILSFRSWFLLSGFSLLVSLFIGQDILSGT